MIGPSGTCSAASNVLAPWERDQVSGAWQDLHAFEHELAALMLALLRAGA